MTKREKAASAARVADHMKGIDNLVELENARRDSLPVAWSITEGEYLLYHSHHAMTLDQVIAEELAEGAPAYFGGWDRAVWHGERCMAILRPRADGTYEAIRIA